MARLRGTGYAAASLQSIAIIGQLMNQRMFPLTLAGLEGAMRLLSK
jgi:uncharacterized protein with von Willebrand factor type A (vWA) domain